MSPVNKRPIGRLSELTYRDLADPSRRHLLRLLDDAAGPVEVGELSEQVGLQPNTVREHLDLLSRADLVTRTSERRTKPGRPRILYQAAPRNYRSPGAEGYKFLAEILASYIDATVDDPAGAAEEAGRAWGRHLADRPAPFVHLEPSQVVNQITTTLADFGFAPEEAEAGERIVVKLHDCLFREMARDRGDVVCSIHLRILRGMAEELGDSVTVDGLHPFVEPSLCIVQLSTRE